MTERERHDLGEGAAILLALADLSDVQRHALIGRHFRSMTHDALAEERGVSKQAVYLAEVSALRRLAVSLAPLREQLLAA